MKLLNRFKYVILSIWIFGCSFWFGGELHKTKPVTGTIIGLTQDQVKSGKSSFTNHFQAAVKFQDGSSTTINLPFHTFIQSKVGSSVTYAVPVYENEGLYLFPAAILMSLGFVGFIFSMLEAF